MAKQRVTKNKKILQKTSSSSSQISKSTAKAEFPIFNQIIRGKKLIYLDSAATTQKPRVVIDAIKTYYETINANIHRGVYSLSEKSTQAYEGAREKVATFIGAESKEIIFTRNATEAINLVAHSIMPILKERGFDDEAEILISEMEHHANLIPWQELAHKEGMTLKYIPVKKDYTLDYNTLSELIHDGTAIIAINHISNSLGTVNDIAQIRKIMIQKSSKAILLVDAAQSIAHQKIHAKEPKDSIAVPDFVAFSGHKMYAGTGIGVLYGRKELLEKMSPFLTGGDMIKEVTYEHATWNDIPHKFEAGTPDIAGAVSLGVAIDFLNSKDMESIAKHESTLTQYALSRLKEMKGVTLYNPQAVHQKNKTASIVSFNLDGIHTHDVASLLDTYGICVRGGHHCTMPLMKKLGLQGTVRVSFAIYNTKEDIDALCDALLKIQTLFKRN